MSFLVAPLYQYLRRVEIARKRVVRYIDDNRLPIWVCEVVEFMGVIYGDGTIEGGLVVCVRNVFV